MSELATLAGRMHSEFCGAVDLAQEVAALGQEDSIHAVGRRWSLAIDILSRTARIYNGAKAVLHSGSATLNEFARSSFCLSWYRDFAQLRNTECQFEISTMKPGTCAMCKEGYLPCKKTLETSKNVQRGMRPCREMRNRYEHYEEYFAGRGMEQKRYSKDGISQRAAAKPASEPWVLESSLGDNTALEIRIDVYERGGLRAFVLDVDATIAGLKPVVQAAVRHPSVFDNRHEQECRYCR